MFILFLKVQIFLLYLTLGQALAWQPNSHNSRLENETRFEKGSLFLLKGRLKVVNNHVIVPCQYDYKVLLSRFGMLITGINGVIKELISRNKTEYITELNSVKEEIRRKVAGIDSVFHGYQITHKTGRRKRGAMNFVGSIANVLFGVAEETQVVALNKIITNVTSVSENNLKDLNIIKSAIGLTSHKLNKIRGIQIKTLNSISKLRNQAREISLDVENLAENMMFEHELNMVRLSMLELFFEANDIVEGVKNLFAGIYSDSIISNKYLLNILNEIKLNGHQLMLPDDTLHLETYKHIMGIFGVFSKEQDTFIFFLAIPTSSSLPLPDFELYEVHTFPNPIHNGFGAVVKYHDLPKFIGTSSNSKYFLEFDDLQDCKYINNNYFCKLKNNIFDFEKSKRCAAVLYSNKPNYLEHCKFSIAKDAADKIKKVLNRFYYFINETVKMEIVCKNSSYNRHVVLKGLGFVNLAPRCEGIGPSLLLPSSVASYEPVHSIKVFNKPINYSLKVLNTSVIPFSSETLKNLTKDLNKDVSVDELLLKLNVPNQPLSVHYRYDFVDAVIIVILLSLLVIAFGFYRGIIRVVPVEHNEQLYADVIPPALPPLNLRNDENIGMQHNQYYANI